MPNYRYRCDQCGSRWEAFRHMASPEADCVCGSPGTIVIQKVPTRIRHAMKGDMRDYREDLARFAGDPEALVDGPKSLQKLIDKRKRQGWQMGPIQDMKRPKPVSSEQIVRESYEAAKARDFKFEGEE